MTKLPRGKDTASATASGYEAVAELARREGLVAPHAIHVLLDVEMRGGQVSARVSGRGTRRTMALVASFERLSRSKIEDRLGSVEMYEDEALRPEGFHPAGRLRWVVAFAPVGRTQKRPRR